MKLRLAIGLAALLALPLAATAQDPAPASTQASAAAPRSASSDIDLADLLARYAKRSGKQLILDPRVHAQVPLAGMNPDRVGYDELLAILSVHQFAAVTQGDRITVVPDLYARQLPTPVFTDRNFKTAAPDELVTLLVNVQHVCAAQAVPVLRPLMPQAAHMAAFVETNTLILSDHASNVHRLVTVIEALERAGADGTAADCPGRAQAPAPAK